MTDNSLFAEPEKDGFKHESPIRAFTSYTMAGGYFIGKGFRPSLQHLTEYLDAMERKEGYSLVQLLEAATGAPTMIFRRDPAWVGTDAYKQIADLVRDPTEGERRPIAMAALGAPYGEPEVTSDPVNPDHYAGRACADIGERLSANGYQILKYCWRLGKKDEACQELGKALWYVESEMELLALFLTGHKFSPVTTGICVTLSDFLEDRIEDQPQFTQNIARMLWAGYDRRRLQAIKECIAEHRFHLECGRGLAV